MDSYISPEVRKGIQVAQEKALQTSGRVSVHVGDEAFSIDRLWDSGFEIDRLRDPKLRGAVDIYDGPKHLFSALIIYSELEGEAMRYEFKQVSQAREHAPIDFVQEQSAPIALLK